MASDNPVATYSRRYAARNYHSTGPRAPLQSVDVPQDVERIDDPAPCFLCGTARGPCRHRPWLEAAA